jgi:hypothetical protein
MEGFGQADGARMIRSKNCAVCGAENPQLHHLSYDPEMVIPLCKDCHTKVHKHGTGRPNANLETSLVIGISLEKKIRDLKAETLMEFMEKGNSV